MDDDQIRLIESEADLAEGCAHLIRVCPVWARVLPDLSPLPLRRGPDGFEALQSAVASQQLSAQAADTIIGRLRAAGLMQADAFLAADDEALRACGLSRPKIRYLRGIAAAGIDWQGLRRLPDAEVTRQLTALPGIGRWTAEIYLKFALGRADAFAAGDLALQEAARVLYDLEARPSAGTLEEMAEPWRPWRSVAARALWSYYRVTKGREGVT